MTQTTVQKNEVKLNVMSEQIKNIQTDISEIKASLHELTMKIDSTYVTKEELRPIKAITYGLVGAVLMATLAALTDLILVH